MKYIPQGSLLSTNVCITAMSPMGKGRSSSVGTVLGSLSCMMRHPGFDPPLSLWCRGFFPLELTWVLTPLPETLLDESINRGLVCAHMHSTAQTQRSWHSCPRRMNVVKKTHQECTIYEDRKWLSLWFDLKTHTHTHKKNSHTHKKRPHMQTSHQKWLTP